MPTLPHDLSQEPLPASPPPPGFTLGGGQGRSLRKAGTPQPDLQNEDANEAVSTPSLLSTSPGPRLQTQRDQIITIRFICGHGYTWAAGVGVGPLLTPWPPSGLAPSPPPPPVRKELRPMKREGRGHKLGAEETGVNRIFKAGHSSTPLASVPPSPLCQ